MKKLILFSLLLASLLASCTGVATSSSEGSSSEESISYSSYSSQETPVYEGAIAPVVSFDVSEARFEDGLLYGSEDSFALACEDALLSEDGLLLKQGGIIQNLAAYSCLSQIEVVFSSASELAVFYGKGSYWSIDNGAIGASCLESGVSLDLGEDARFFSLHAALGDILIESITLCSNYVEAPKAKEIEAIDFYTINDTHGAIEYNGESDQYQLGIERLSTLYRNAYESNPDGTVILSSGDMWQGSAMSNLSYGEAMIDWMNAVGFDSMSLGNHEFDWGMATIESNAFKANFPFLGINVVDAGNERPGCLSASTVLTRGGVRIGVIGAIGMLESSILPSSLGEYRFASYGGLISKEADRLRIAEGCDLVVVSIHNGDFDTTYCHNIDAVFLGHTHEDIYFVDDYGIPHLETYANGSNVRSARFVKEGDDWVYEGRERNASFYDNKNNAPEEVASLIVEHFDGKFAAIMDEVVGYASTTIDQSDLASIGAEVLYDFYQDSDLYPIPEIAIVNSGCARQDIVAGEITYGDLYAVFPFDNDHIFATIKGSDLSTVASRNVTYPAGRAFDSAKTYTVVIISYAYENVDFYFEEELGRDSVNRLRDCAAAYFKNQASI